MQASRLPVSCLRHIDTALRAYFRRQESLLWAMKAITATAHQLASLVYRMLTFDSDYARQEMRAYEANLKGLEL